MTSVSCIECHIPTILVIVIIVLSLGLYPIVKKLHDTRQKGGKIK